jgi:hypothetical protein
MSIASAVFEAGQIHFPERAHWHPDLEAELFSFPGSQYDDQVDSISQVLNHARSSSLGTWRKLAALESDPWPIPISAYLCALETMWPYRGFSRRW